MTVQCDERSDLEALDTHHEPVKKSSKKACLKCNERGGVLVCSNGGCPIVVHKDCMSCVARFDDEGNFYCPYCAYKRSLGECQKAKECAILAKKALDSFLDTKAVRSTGDVQIVRSSKRERPEGSDFTFQKDILQNGLSMKLEVPKKPDVIGDFNSGGVCEGTIYVKSLNDDLHLVTDKVIPVKQKSEKMKTKRHKTAMASVGYCNQGLKRKEPQRESHRGTVCSTRNYAMDKEEGSDEINATTLQDEFTSFEQLEVNSENGDQSAETQKDISDDGKVLEESGFFSGKHQGTKDTEEVYHEEMQEKELQPVQASIYLTRNDDLTVMNETSVQADVTASHVTVNIEDAGFEGHLCGRTDEEQTLVKSVKDDVFHQNKFALVSHDSRNLVIDLPEAAKILGRDIDVESDERNIPAFEADNVIGSQMTMNLENVDQPAEIGDHHESPYEKQIPCKTTINAESVNLATENQQNKNAMDGNCDGLAKKVHNELVLQEVNCGLHEDENLSRSHMAVNKNNADQTSDIGDFLCRRADEGVKQVKLQKNDVVSTSKGNPGVSYEEFDSGDESKSSQESHHTGYGLRSKRKSRISAHSEIGNQQRKSSRSSESEIENYEEVTHVKSRQKVDSLKQIQHTPVYVGRRKKLPWTIEEEETLKEGVDKFSQTANKNMPWMKILDFGSHIFDGTRTPDDLKDKWKRILNKANANATRVKMKN